jgi:pyrimidine-nucleoside phosphorylase
VAARDLTTGARREVISPKMAQPSPVQLIIKKRDGGVLAPGQIRSLIDGFMGGDIPDYQMSAWLMAAFWRGLDEGETVALTEAMLHSGRTLRLASVRAPKVDKHSTGGVGDKISLCLAPLVATCGVAVPMISGRGLGHTGGTLDKLEAIAGYRVHIDVQRFERIVAEVGCSIIGQTEQLAPADRRIYALRDVTGTVESIPLIVASILCKKLAAKLDGLVLDVKCGSGAFMKDLESARALARMLVRVGRRAGQRVVGLITDMAAPLGRTIGNALETAEAIEVLRGGGPHDTRELALELGARMLTLAGVENRTAAARRRLSRALRSGAAAERFARMVAAHGGDSRVVDDVSRLPRAPQRVPVPALRSGLVRSIDAYELGLVSVALGAGRVRADQPVDPAVGIELAKKPGEHVARGEPLAWLHGRSAASGRAQLGRARRAFQLGQQRPEPNPLLLDTIRG